MSAEMPTTCPNCGHRLAAWDKFCSQCGQDTANHPPSLWEFVHEFLLHYVAFEGKLWKSLWALMGRPGFLTQEYLAGRKQRYVLPLRLVLTLGLVFFVALKLIPGDTSLVQVRPSVSASAPEAATAPRAPLAQAKEEWTADRRQREAPTAGPSDDEQFDLFVRQLPPGLAAALERSRARFKADTDAELRRVAARMLAFAPYAVLCSLPFYAGLLALLYRNRRHPFGTHFVFALHLHAAWYGVLLFAQLPGWPFGLAAFFWANAYPLLALKRVYGGAWWATLLRAAGLLMLHVLVLLAGLLVLGVLGALA